MLTLESVSNKIAALVVMLEEWPWRDTVRTLLLRFREDRLGLTAGSLTFTTLISLVPLLTVMLAVFSVFPMFGSFQVALEQYFLKRLIPEDIARPVLKALTQFSTKAQGVGTIGVIFLVISALALMLTIDRTLNTIWRVRKPRSLAQRMLLYWAVATLGPLLLGASLSFTSYAVSASKGWVHALPGGVTVLLNLIQFVLLTCGLAALFHFVPNTHVRWKHAFTGAIVAMLGFELAKRGLGLYLSTVPTYAVIYGAFATVPILLIWVFLSWSTFLLGAVIAAYAPSLKLGLLRYADVAGANFQLAVGVLRLLAQARGDDRRGLNPEDISAHLRVDPLQIGPLLDRLVAMDWVGRLEEPESARYTLLCDPAKTLASPLIADLLLEPTNEGLSLWHQAKFDQMSLQALISH